LWGAQDGPDKPGQDVSVSVEANEGRTTHDVIIWYQVITSGGPT
jgi:hypothetical protein